MIARIFEHRDPPAGLKISNRVSNARRNPKLTNHPQWFTVVSKLCINKNHPKLFQQNDKKMVSKLCINQFIIGFSWTKNMLNHIDPCVVGLWQLMLLSSDPAVQLGSSTSLGSCLASHYSMIPLIDDCYPKATWDSYGTWQFLVSCPRKKGDFP